jgi:ATP-dependent helicase/nuclease subunit B
MMERYENSGTQPTAAVFFERVARAILAQHAPPDLRGAIVLLPNYHVAQPLAQALARVGQQPAILLPRMVTLGDWAQSVPLPQPVVSDLGRTATLYQALRARDWFCDADLWRIARELLALLDELTQHRVVLPRDEADFLEQLEQAYQARRNTAMQFEARVVHELWYALGVSGELDAARAYQQRLAQLAQRAEEPLYALLASDLVSSEARFIEAYAERAPVQMFDLRQMAQALEARAARQSSAYLFRLERGDSLRERAAQLRDQHPQAALGERLCLFGAHGLEQEARAAELQVRRWLLAGKRNIALVAQDRLVARRVRALLERADVLLRDETGWMFSTLAVSTVLVRWLDALQSGFYHQDLLDLLKSPFIFAGSDDEQPGVHKQAVFRLEQAVRKHGVASGLDAYFDLARGEAEVERVLARLRQAADAMGRPRLTLSGWLSALQESLDILGIGHGLAADAAGTQLLQALAEWRDDLQADDARYALGEWRQWLMHQLDAQTFRDTAVESTVLLTHLAATRWRRFDAVLLLGCDAAHLPGIEGGDLLFNDAVRGTLGLPTRDTVLARQRDDLFALLALNDCVLATWQAERDGEPNLLSPYLETLRALHQLAYGDDLAERGLSVLLETAQVRSAEFTLPQASAMPRPAVPPGLVPLRISPSGYNSLVTCPYQFYARHMLKLNELDEIQEGIEKRDFGEWVHEVLHRFHSQYVWLTEHPRAELEAALRHISADVFAEAVEHDYLARAWLLRWQRAIPAYLDEQLKNEAEGWRYQKGEIPFALTLTATLTLLGRIDRVDSKAGATRVMDYKLAAEQRLRARLKEAGEDVQLACYAYAYEAEAAAFISIEREKVKIIVPPQQVSELAQANIGRLCQVFAEMREGAGLPAHGVEEACAWCEMRGLCRKTEWA